MGRRSHRATPAPRPLLVGILLMCGLGCQRSRLGDGLPAKLNCYSCHGSKKNSAPPLAVNGATSTSDIGVGAHQAHVNDGAIAGLIACEECHGEMPTVMDGISHPDPLSGGTVVKFVGPLAQTGGATPAWNRTTGTCTNTYCHGATLPGRFTPAPPRWTKVDGSQAKCDSCHGDVPADLGASHPRHTAYTCDTCHANVVSAGLTVLDPYLHVDGLVDVSMAAGTWDPVTRTCANTTAPCHGSTPW
ncbi:MAG TPA: CxxxxCH/CxxCH domain-containing protein [Polyangia bacterium]|jgi:Geobacter CxxxxCH.|nr:CxxxxCH/CxxCH domain-containing protein [Polyangia bacterium]